MKLRENGTIAPSDRTVVVSPRTASSLNSGAYHAKEIENCPAVPTRPCP